MIIPRVSEAIDGELISQGIALGTIDAERLAIAAINATADHLAKEGFPNSPIWLRSQMTEGR